LRSRFVTTGVDGALTTETGRSIVSGIGRFVLVLIAVRTCSYLGEDDIIRIEDDYRRS